MADSRCSEGTDAPRQLNRPRSTLIKNILNERRFNTCDSTVDSIVRSPKPLRHPNSLSCSTMLAGLFLTTIRPLRLPRTAVACIRAIYARSMRLRSYSAHSSSLNTLTRPCCWIFVHLINQVERTKWILQGSKSTHRN